ncbi:MAG: hypothetical protein H6636_14420 [Anaerolineales bacterium]|nr:hypothetical protein [Anaerolineales bacterium]
MPRVSIWFIRSALIYLLFGFTLGAFILTEKGTALIPTAWQLLPAHIEALLFGWTIQLILGTAFWILPRFPQEPKRGNEKVIWGVYILLNLGILLVAVGSFFLIHSLLFFAGRLLEGCAVCLFVIAISPRVKPFAS